MASGTRRWKGWSLTPFTGDREARREEGRPDHVWLGSGASPGSPVLSHGQQAQVPPQPLWRPPWQELWVPRPRPDLRGPTWP